MLLDGPGARGISRLISPTAVTTSSCAACRVEWWYGELGPTHHSIEDVAWTRAIADLPVIVPADPIETAQAVRAIARSTVLPFLRLSRLPVLIVHHPLVWRSRWAGQPCFVTGSDSTLIANG